MRLSGSAPPHPPPRTLRVLEYFPTAIAIAENRSKTTDKMGKPKRQVLAAVEDTLTPPDTLQDNQSIVRVLKPEGNNLYTCLLPNKEKLVLELAQIFRNTIWVRRGGFVLADKYPEKSEETRAAGEIVNVVRDEKLWRKQAYW